MLNTHHNIAAVYKKKKILPHFQHLPNGVFKPFLILILSIVVALLCIVDIPLSTNDMRLFKSVINKLEFIVK